MQDGNIYGDSSGYRARELSLDQSLINNLKLVHQELQKLEDGEGQIKIKDPILKRKIAKVSFVLTNSPLERGEIFERANMIADFGRYKFNDELDNIFAKAMSLSPPESYEDVYIFTIWKWIKSNLEDYLTL